MATKRTKKRRTTAAAPEIVVKPALATLQRLRRHLPAVATFVSGRFLCSVDNERNRTIARIHDHDLLIGDQEPVLSKLWNASQHNLR